MQGYVLHYEFMLMLYVYKVSLQFDVIVCNFKKFGFER